MTLTELLIGCAIGALILGASNGLFGVGTKTYQRTYSSIINIQENRQIEDKITSELKYANDVTIPSTPFTSISYAVSGDVRQILFDQTTKSVTFTTTTPATTTRLAQNGISNVIFTMVQGGGNGIKGEITITVTYVNQSTFQFKVLTMNDVY
jgi:hypothetical protein